jgi:hypothetical protein
MHVSAWVMLNVFDGCTRRERGEIDTIADLQIRDAAGHEVTEEISNYREHPDRGPYWKPSYEREHRRSQSPFPFLSSFVATYAGAG